MPYDGAYDALRRPFLGQDVDLDLLLCTLRQDSISNMLIRSYALFLRRDQLMIERVTSLSSPKIHRCSIISISHKFRRQGPKFTKH